MKQGVEDTVQEALDEQVELPSEHPSWQEVLGYAWKSYVPRTMQAVGRSLAKFGSPALKCLLYPLTGNLPAGIQRSLEERTQGWYGADDAMLTSCFTNILVYCGIPYAALPASWSPEAKFGAFLAGAMYSVIEAKVRNRISDHGRKPCGSLPGTVLVLPYVLWKAGRDAVAGALEFYSQLEDEAVRARKD